MHRGVVEGLQRPRHQQRRREKARAHRAPPQTSRIAAAGHLALDAAAGAHPRPRALAPDDVHDLPGVEVDPGALERRQRLDDGERASARTPRAAAAARPRRPPTGRAAPRSPASRPLERAASASANASTAHSSERSGSAGVRRPTSPPASRTRAAAQSSAPLRASPARPRITHARRLARALARERGPREPGGERARSCRLPPTAAATRPRPAPSSALARLRVGHARAGGEPFAAPRRGEPSHPSVTASAARPSASAPPARAPARGGTHTETRSTSRRRTSSSPAPAAAVARDGDVLAKDRDALAARLGPGRGLVGGAPEVRAVRQPHRAQELALLRPLAPPAESAPASERPMATARPSSSARHRERPRQRPAGAGRRGLARELARERARSSRYAAFGDGRRAPRASSGRQRGRCGTRPGRGRTTRTPGAASSSVPAALRQQRPLEAAASGRHLARRREAVVHRAREDLEIGQRERRRVQQRQVAGAAHVELQRHRLVLRGVAAVERPAATLKPPTRVRRSRPGAPPGSGRTATRTDSLRISTGARRRCRRRTGPRRPRSTARRSATRCRWWPRPGASG